MILRSIAVLATFLALGACSQKTSDRADQNTADKASYSNPGQIPQSASPSEVTAVETSHRIMSKAEMDARLREQMKPLKRSVESFPAGDHKEESI